MPEFLVVVHDTDNRYFVDAQIADSSDSACAAVCDERKNVVEAVAFRASEVQKTLSELKLLARALKARPA